MPVYPGALPGTFYLSFHQLALARHAYRKFGKGIHLAALNFGDCFSYALAKASNEPLLFKGAEFSQTDIIPALPT